VSGHDEQRVVDPDAQDHQQCQRAGEGGDGHGVRQDADERQSAQDRGSCAEQREDGGAQRAEHHQQDDQRGEQPDRLGRQAAARGRHLLVGAAGELDLQRAALELVERLSRRLLGRTAGVGGGEVLDAAVDLVDRELHVGPVDVHQPDGAVGADQRGLGAAVGRGPTGAAVEGAVGRLDRGHAQTGRAQLPQRGLHRSGGVGQDTGPGVQHHGPGRAVLVAETGRAQQFGDRVGLGVRELEVVLVVRSPQP